VGHLFSLDANVGAVMDHKSTSTILVVDDEPHVRHVLEHKLRKAGWTVWAAEDGIAGLELAKQHHPDIIVSDYHMPGLNGLEFALLLQNDPATAEIPVVMLTAHDTDVLRQPLGERNIRALINKPFSPSEVVQLVARLTAMSAEADAEQPEGS
jgi:CheY-like chemotaxis protein